MVERPLLPLLFFATARCDELSMALQVRLEGRKIALRVRAKGSAQLDLIGHAALAHVAGKRAANSAARRAVARLEAAVDAPFEILNYQMRDQGT